MKIWKYVKQIQDNSKKSDSISPIPEEDQEKKDSQQLENNTDNSSENDNCESNNQSDQQNEQSEPNQQSQDESSTGENDDKNINGQLDEDQSQEPKDEEQQDDLEQPQPSSEEQQESDQESSPSEESNQPGQGEESNQPGQSEESNQPGQSEESNQQNQSEESNQPGQSEESNQPGQSEESNQPGQGEESNQPNQSEESNQLDQGTSNGSLSNNNSQQESPLDQTQSNGNNSDNNSENIPSQPDSQDKKSEIEYDQNKNNSSDSSSNETVTQPEYTKEQLEELRDKLSEYSEKKKEQGQNDFEQQEKTEKQNGKKVQENLHPESAQSQESEEDSYEFSEQANDFLNQLNELPSFENRDRGPGYSIDTKSKSEIPESIVRTLITKFLNQRFCRRNSDLNVRSNSLEKSEGFYKWEVKDVIVHSKTHQLNKVLNDKYSYEYAEGQGDNIPLSFYFDMSGSMSSYTNMLATLAIELLKKDVKVLIGFNERVNVQIDSIAKNITIEELAKILTSAGYSSWGYKTKESFIKDSRVKFRYIDRNIDNYLLEKKAEKCVIFSDFDPIDEVINLSHSIQTYWFCFESSFDKYSLRQYNGFAYSVRNAEDILEGLVKINEKRFETLCYVDNPKQLQKRRTEK